MSISSDLPRFRNRAKGILPTATGFATAPTNLENVTDEDPATVTGTGTTTVPAVLGYISLDLGAVYPVLVMCTLGLWSAAGNVTVNLSVSADGITYRSNSGRLLNITTSVAEQVGGSEVEFAWTRYIRIDMSGTAATVKNVKIYEIMALDCRPGVP